MPTVKKFLDAVLPVSPGYIAVGSGQGGPTSTTFVQDSSGIIAAIGKALTVGHDLYYTPAVYSRRKRLADLCTDKRCIVIDIDLNHPKKPSYATQDEAIKAFFVALMAVKLPVPSYILSSGRGLHIYWALDHDTAPDRWLPVATSVKKALSAADIKLACDTSRWADLAGYLRVPGSINTKSGKFCEFYEKKGQHLGSEVAYPLKALATTSVPSVMPLTGGAMIKLPDRNGPRKASVEQAEATEIPRPIELIADCVPLSVLSDDPSQDYDAWWGMARLFARAKDLEKGRQAYHVASMIYPKYDEEKVDAKFAEAVSNSKASPTCAQFRAWAGLDTKACRNCPLFQAQGENGKPAALQTEFIDAFKQENITSSTLDAEVTLLERARQARLNGGYAPLNALGLKVPKNILKKMPDDRTGVWIDAVTGFMMANVEVKDGKSSYIETRLIARRPFWIEARIAERDPSGATLVFGARIVQARLINDEWCGRFVTVPATELNAGAGAVLSTFNTYGLDVEATDSRDAGFRALHRYIRRTVNQIDTSRAHNKEASFGWRNLKTEPSFVIGDRMYGKGGTTVLIEQEGGAFDMNPKVGQEGTLAEAKRISSLAMKNSLFPLRLVMLAALGAPLIHMTPVEGAMVLLAGETGRGKTAAMSYANSFYGSSKPGHLLASGTDTPKSIMHMLGIMGNIPAFIDETTLMQRDALASVMLQITQGAENNRLEASNNRLRQRNRWQTIAIASSNNSVSDIIDAATFAGEAQQMRVIEVGTFDTRDDEMFYKPGTAAFVNDVLTPSHKNYGLLGTEFIKHVIEHYDDMKKLVLEVDAMLRTGNTVLAAKQGDPFRVWRAVATVCVVAGITGEKMGFWKMSGSFLDQIKNHLIGAASEQKVKAKVAVGSWVSDFIALNQAGIVIDTVKDRTGKVVDVDRPDNPELDRIGGAAKKTLSHVPLRSAVARLTLTEGQDTAVCTILGSAFRRFCRAEGYDMQFIITKLEQGGMLIEHDKPRQITKDSPLPAAPSTISTVGGEALPAVSSFTVKLRLAKPYVIGEDPEYI